MSMDKLILMWPSEISENTCTVITYCTVIEKRIPLALIWKVIEEPNCFHKIHRMGKLYQKEKQQE